MTAEVTDLARERAARHPERLHFHTAYEALVYARQQLDAERAKFADVLLAPTADLDESFRVVRGLLTGCIDAHVRIARERKEQQQ